jgi:hypothetical protein
MRAKAPNRLPTASVHEELVASVAAAPTAENGPVHWRGTALGGAGATHAALSMLPSSICRDKHPVRRSSPYFFPVFAKTPFQSSFATVLGAFTADAADIPRTTHAASGVDSAHEEAQACG